MLHASIDQQYEKKTLALDWFYYSQIIFPSIKTYSYQKFMYV